MIVDTLARGGLYAPLHPHFARAFRFLAGSGVASLPAGRHEIDGERLFAIVSRSPGRRREEGRLETHDRYIDIQYVFSGSDEMGWKPREALRLPAGPHSTEKDIRFYEDDPDGWFPVREGSFALFFPGDGHLPLVSDGEIGKVVVKVAVE